MVGSSLFFKMCRIIEHIHDGGTLLFVGHTRFSLFNPHSTSFQASNGSKFATSDEYQAYLYSDARLDMRTEIFIKQSLPQLELAIGGHDVRHIVAYSDSLPRKYQRVLEDAAARYPFVVLDRQSAGQAVLRTEEVASELVNREGHDPAQAFGVYRLDDDDLLPVSFFDQNAQHIRPDNAGMHVSLGTGITVLYIDGSYYSARLCYSPMFSAGLMNICRFDESGNLVAPGIAPHNVSDRTSPVILDSRKIGYFWVRHLEQDTSLGLGTSTDEALLEKLRNHINQHPAASLVDIQNAFPAVSHKVFLEAEPGDSGIALLGSTRTLGSKGIALPLPAKSGRFELTIDLTCGADAVPRNLLLGLDLVNETGAPIDPTSMKDALGEAGISFSGNPSIGFFRYLHSNPGRRVRTYEFDLPEGSLCQGLTFKLWRRIETSISFRAINVSAK